jgi:hypothetical protein
MLIDENGGAGPGVRLRKPQRKRRLATGRAWCGKGQPLVSDQRASRPQGLKSFRANVLIWSG